MNLFSIKIGRLILFLLGVISITMVACEKETMGLPMIKQVRLLSATAARDSFFTQALPGTFIIIEGQNFTGTQNIYFNDVEVPFNSALMKDNSIVLQIPANVPTEATKPNVSNKLRLVTDHGEAVFDFKLVPPAPSVTSISNEMAAPGTTITIRGTYLYGIQKVVFPGNIDVTNFTVSADTTQINVTVPASVTQSGTLQVVGKYGTGVNPYIVFNGLEQPGMLANFEDGNPKFGWAYWGGVKTNDAVKFPGNRGNYIEIKPAGSINAGDGVWYADNRVVNVSANPLIPAANLGNPIGNYALKFEMFQRTSWQNGTLRIRLGNPWTYSYDFSPWKTAPSNTYQTTGWTTVTIPLTSFVNSSGNPASTLTALTDKTNGDLGIMLINNSTAALPQYNAAFDNIRIVRVQ